MKRLNITTFFSAMLVLALYVGSARLGLWLGAGTWANITPVWPPTGIAIASLRIFGYRFWPIITVGAFITNAWTPAPLSAAFFIAIGNTLEALSVTYLWSRLTNDSCRLERVRDVSWFIMVAAPIGTAVAAIIGVLTLDSFHVINHDSVVVALFTWWLGDLVGAVVVTPLFLTGRAEFWKQSCVGSPIEFGILVGSVLILSLVIFTHLLPFTLSPLPVAYLVFPLLTWAAIRFGPWGSSTAIVLISFVAIWGTMQGWGIYHRADALNSLLLLLMAFVGTACYTTLLLAASVNELRTAQEQVSLLNEKLEARVAERTAQLVDAHQSLQRSERLASIGTFAAGIAHEINNPAASILSSAQLALERLDDGKDGVSLVRTALKEIVTESKRCGNIVKNVLQFARNNTLEKRPADLNEIAERAMRQTTLYAEQAGARITIALDPNLPRVSVNSLAIEQVLVNLVRNAVEAGGSNTTVVVRTQTAKDCVKIVVEDDGPGLTAEAQSQVFDPFFTTRMRGGGTGLGLSICHGIVNEHRGKINIESAIGKGTQFIVWLPTTGANRAYG